MKRFFKNLFHAKERSSKGRPKSNEIVRPHNKVYTKISHPLARQARLQSVTLGNIKGLVQNLILTENDVTVLSEKMTDLGKVSMVTGSAALNELTDAVLEPYQKAHLIVPYLAGILTEKGDTLSLVVLHEILTDFVVPRKKNHIWLDTVGESIANLILNRLQVGCESDQTIEHAKRNLVPSVQAYLQNQNV